MKRDGYITWDEYFMGVAQLAAKRSKDPGTQVGACIIDENKHILSVGYNGMPMGCSDDEYPWEREGEMLDTKYAYVCHAELNAILNCKASDLRGTTVYVTLFPCNECTKAIIQKGIKNIIYLDDKYHDMDMEVAARRMLDSAKVTYKRYVPGDKEITIKV